jgi:hypothetical protein
MAGIDPFRLFMIVVANGGLWIENRSFDCDYRSAN